LVFPNLTIASDRYAEMKSGLVRDLSRNGSWM
jgi:hypothetical protein